MNLLVNRPLALLAAMACMLASTPTTADACSIPVFRYALERWKPTAYEAVVFHRGDLDDAQRKAIQALTADGDRGLNLSLTLIDLASTTPDPVSQKLWEQQKNATLPWLLIHAPDAAANTPPVFAGPLTAASAAGLADSPARRTIAQRLLKGESAVWVMVDSGDAKADAATAKLLTERLKALEEQLRLQEFDQPQERAPDEPGLLSKLPLKLRFSMLRISPADPAEAMFVRLLRSTEPELKKRAAGEAAEPIVFPIFGQGRVLCGLEGKNITADTLEDCAAFLVGDCSCRVKELNPGVDLLMVADWGSILDVDAPAEPELNIPDPVIGSGKPKRAASPAAPAKN